ncbi:uncharacterized protein LOC110368081 [Fundulus heteroclitus]|uniref:uncharacterized protein LOC110368081 n=1 Tax=Fundulus heteroclitus TaxID=8078 RepID=UPI00165B309B|nr:uncharacterized protein LOC110368081 [Fundulus heteroclitus]
MRIISRCEEDNLRIMEGRSDGSAELVSSLPQRRKKRPGRKRKVTASQILQAAPGSAQKIPEPEAANAADQRAEGSDLKDGSIISPDRVSPPDEPLAPSEGDSLCPEAPNSSCGDPDLLDHPGGESPPCKHRTDFHPAQKRDELLPPNDQTDAEGRAPAGPGGHSERRIYHSVLHQLLQQQKHRPGRKHKKKTLMKMAQLLVIAKGWDRREDQSLSLEEQTNLKEELFTSRSRKPAPAAGPSEAEPANLESSQIRTQTSDPAPDEQKESRETGSESVREESWIPPESRKQGAKAGVKRRRKAAKANAGGRKKDPPEENSGGFLGCFTLENKEEGAPMDPTAGKESELRIKKKPGRKKRIRKMAEPSETESLSVSPGGKRRRKQDLQPAAEAAAPSDAGLSEFMSSQSGSPGSAQQSLPQEMTEKPGKARNPAAEQLPTGGDPLQQQNQTSVEEKLLPPHVLPKSGHRKPARRGPKARKPPRTASILDPSAETSIIQDESGRKPDVRLKRAAPRGKRTKGFRVKEETKDWSLMCDTSSQKGDEETIQSWKKPKGRGRRKKTTEQTLNFFIKTEPAWDSPVKQTDSPPMDIKSAKSSPDNQSKRKPRKRKDTEDDDASHGAGMTAAGSAGDGAGGNLEILLSPVCGSSEKSGSRKTENPDPNKSGEDLKYRKTRRSCTMGNKTSSAAEEWLIRYLKGSRRRASSKGSNRMAEVSLDGADEQQPTSENGTEVKKKRGRKKSVSPVKRQKVKMKQEPASQFDEGDPPASTLAPDRQQETTKRRRKRKGQKPEAGTTSGGQVASESSGSQVGRRGRRTTTQTEDPTSIKRRRGPKRRRILKTNSEPKILESGENRPHEGDAGAPEDRRASDFTCRNVLTGEEEDGAAFPGSNGTEDSGGPTGDLLQIEATPHPNEDFLGAEAKAGTSRRKPGRRRRRTLKRNITAGPKVLESDPERPQVWGVAAPKVSNVRRGRKRNVFTIKKEEAESCFMSTGADEEPERETSESMSSFQDQSSTAESGVKPGAGPESRGGMNLLRMEGVASDGKDEVFSKVRATKRRRERRGTCKTDSAGREGLESNDSSQERGAGAPEEGKTRKAFSIGRTMTTHAFTIKMEDSTSCFVDMEDIRKEPGSQKWFQEWVSSAAPRKTARKRRRRSKTHWTGNKRAKKAPILRSFSSSCHETFNVQVGNQENQAPAPSGHELPQKKKKEEKKPRCSFCLRSFRHISALTLHKRLHTGVKPYRCAACAKSFSRLAQLKLHSKLHRRPPAAHCPCCQETFEDKSQLLRHLKVHLTEVESLQAEPGRDRQSRSSASRGETFRCPLCSKDFTRKVTFEKHRRIHRRKPPGCRTTSRHPSDIPGFLLSQEGGAAVATPLWFKCPICKQLHRHWCHYVLHLQSHASGRAHRCDACRQDYSGAAGATRHCSACCTASGEEEACGGSLEDIWTVRGASGGKDPQSSGPEAEENISAFPEQECHVMEVVPPAASGASSPSVTEDFDLDADPAPNSAPDSPCAQVSPVGPERLRLGGASWGGRFGGAFPRWSRRRRPSPAFRCRRCELEFRFLGAYTDHLREHAAQTPSACPSCPSCPGTSSEEAQLRSHVSSCCRTPPHSLKCSACGKLFSTPRNLRKHKLLHRGARSHVCLPCSRSFSCRSALKEHLEAHRRRPSAPQPAPVDEPFLFPYPCRKCSASFSSADLLQAHQVCHFVAGRKPDSPPESILSFIPSTQRVPVPPSWARRRLQVSSRKDLFRYPDPDRLYVLPDVSSQPPAVASDTPEETEASPGRKPASAELQLQLLVRSLVPERRLSDSSDSEGEATPRRGSCAHRCVICTERFADVTTLHEHYRNHARGV